ELEEAALQPAAIAGVRLEPKLLARLLADVLDETGALPMFQYTMTELFERRDGDALLESSYEQMGGVRGAITHRAEDLYRQLEPDQQDAARQLFLRLVKISDEQTWSRRRVHAAEIISLNVDVVALQEVIDRFGIHRLLLFDRDLVTGSPTVEVGHEALLSEWPRLEGWIREAGRDLLRHAAFANYVEDWERSGRNPEYLVAGARLTEYELWAGLSSIELNAPELNFLDAALELRELEVRLDEERAAREMSLAGRARWRLWALLAAVAVLAVVAAAIAIPGGDDKLRVALIQTGETGADGLAARGLEEAARRFDTNGFTVTPPWTSVEDVERSQAESGAALIVTDAVLDVGISERLAVEFPDTRFAVFFLPMDAGLPNHVRYVFADEEAAYLAGVAAALETQTGTIGFVGALPVEGVVERLAGFEDGARSVDPSIGLLFRYLSPDDISVSPESGQGVGFFNRPDLGREAALELFAAGADIVYHAAGDSGHGVFRAARETMERTGVQVWGIGSDSDQSFDVPAHDADHVLMSTIRKFDAAVIDAVEMVATDQFVPGTRLLDLSNGGIDYVTTEGRLAPTTVSAMDVAKDSIISGEVVFQLSGRLEACPPVPNRRPDESGYGLVGGGRMLTVGYSPIPEPPYRFEATDGSLLGFEPELLDAIAARMGLQVQYVEAPLEALIRCVAEGSYDVAMNRFGVTPRIQEMVALSSPYLRKSAVLLVSEASGISTIDDIATAVVLRNTPFEEAMRADYPTIEFVVVANPAVPPAMIEAGEVDGWATELSPGLITDDTLVVVEAVAEASSVFPVNPALGGLVTDMNSALAKTIDDGTYEEIYLRFFDTPDYRVDLP
ncbi:MAG: transporter substrate-binding domain-containing protein, partial [Actinomycetota bacterium]|nr:transporter substrate-binding domain-containing protein [Actinomycetota bacterium]